MFCQSEVGGNACFSFQNRHWRSAFYRSHESHRGGGQVTHKSGRLYVQSGRTEETVLPLQCDQDVAAWERVDDVIMGGQSSSAMSLAGDGGGALWSGELVVEGGGFCGTRVKVCDLPESGFKQKVLSKLPVCCMEATTTIVLCIETLRQSSYV